MTVIAKKIAVAAEQPVDRRDANALAESLQPALEKIMRDWLSQDEIDMISMSGRWADPAKLDSEGLIISRQGRIKARRAALIISEPLALAAVSHLLRVKVESDPSMINMLRPFMAETVMGLSDAFEALPIMKGLSDGRDGWSKYSPKQLTPLLGEEEVIHIRMEFLSPGGTEVSLELILLPELLDFGKPTDVQSKAKRTDQPKQAPRLGPCHVDITAIADRLRMSVADCSRLEIGQVVALPGLRFDNLELTVEMGEGPIRLVDASLGADKGIKAVRLNRGLDPDFKAPVAARTKTEAPPVASSELKTVHA